MVHEKFRQSFVAVGTKLERYGNRTDQYKQNCLFKSSQKRILNKLEETQKESVIPDAGRSRSFWQTAKF